MYDDFSADYDRFVDWPGRLAVELPFFERQLQTAGACRVLDAACGTGEHALALARQGYQMAGADLSAKMIRQAETKAARMEARVQFRVAGLGQLVNEFGPQTFEAVLCLGNSLPHVLTQAGLLATLADFAACLRPGGRLLLQNRNFDKVLGQQARWLEPQATREAEREWLFLRFYDFDPDGLLTFNVASLRREGSKPWEQKIMATRLHPWRQLELVGALEAAGFGKIVCWGNMAEAAFEAQVSENLVVAAQKDI